MSVLLTMKSVQKLGRMGLIMGGKKQVLLLHQPQ